ncbi:aminotransferase class V-fold PLP-dependent enzyme [Falsihalocynthiibacter arcticus]|uniref:Aminotransferase class V n=1 Tax=Falsihalocynthiibacter arcticus TaxID=1579316 RepID=A0A126UVL6_9RHOB|nr:aminotransferase class V-fold PLP-dependent enzyme [Falsihalocynthiibacter arcticus]AML50090.1 aminotransferase class V [Falsihalocynthiibacter arcticus]
MPLTSFKHAIDFSDPIAAFRNGLIGEGVMIPGLNGDVPLVYADYVASGRALQQVESFMLEEVLPYYANSHTEASYCGAYMTKLRAAARAEIARLTGAGPDCAVVFSGSGATAGINQLVSLLGVNEVKKAVVFVGPYEHHSNILPWRESAATVVEIPEASTGGPDLTYLETALETYADFDLKIGAFSKASNVTGILTDDEKTTGLLKSHGALAVWDYAGAGPYVSIDMGQGDLAKDAVVISPHKFAGGPGSSGILVLRRASVVRDKPSRPGGGTVDFVSPWAQAYSQKVEAREEAGTPNVLGDIRAALAFLVKERVGYALISERETKFCSAAMAAFLAHPQIEVLGNMTAKRLPIFSLCITDSKGAPIHQQLFTRMLSDVYGIQARGGCACAGPYAHRLLGIERPESEALLAAIRGGEELRKPGWVRLNFSYLMADETAHKVIHSLIELAENAQEYMEYYQADAATARFVPRVKRAS